MLGETPVIVPSGDQDHVIAKIFPLDLCFLEDDNVGLEDIEHGVEGSFVSPWLIAEGIADAVDIPGGDSDAHGGGYWRRRRLIVRSGSCHARRREMWRWRWKWKRKE